MGAVTVHQRAPVGTLVAGAKLDRYEILARLAAGGMATVYVGRVQAVAGFERLVAIKVLHQNLAHEDEFIRMFLDEARLAASIRHPNVVPTIDVSDSKEAGCGYFIVMEYIEGDHLGALLASAHKSGERLALPIVLRIVADALGGLGAAHALCDDTGKSLHLVHRDVSPHNILVGRDGVVRLTDFGVAKAEDRLAHTRDGQVKGKLAYMAPEQAGSGATDARSDLFSMGVILWECVTGQRLFRAETTAATLHKLMHAPIPAPSSLDPALAPVDALVAKALARAPADRFQSAEEFARAIEEIAPAVGGLASMRGVARAVKHYAAAKLKREKKLVDDALRALRTEGEELDEERGTSEDSAEHTGPSNTDISVSLGSLSASKASGVFSHDTLPGMRRQAARNAGETSSLLLSAADASEEAEQERPTLRFPARVASAAQLVAAQRVLGSGRMRRASLIGAVLAAAATLAFTLLSPAAEPPRAAAEATPAVVSGPPGTASTVALPSTSLSGSMTTATAAAVGVAARPAEPPPKAASALEAAPKPASATDAVGPTRSVRGVRTRDEAPARSTRRLRKESTRRDRVTNSAPPVRSDVMPNPYHDH